MDAVEDRLLESIISIDLKLHFYSGVETMMIASNQENSSYIRLFTMYRVENLVGLAVYEANSIFLYNTTALRGCCFRGFHVFTRCF